MKQLFFILLLSALSLNLAFSQTSKQTYDFEALGLFTDHSADGRIMITSDSRLPDIIKRYINYLYRKPLRGWRVELYFGIGKKGKKEAQNIKEQFASLYPDIPVYIYFEQPYFKVKAGNFTSQKTAQRLMFDIKEEFPRAFIVEDRIDPNNIND